MQTRQFEEYIYICTIYYILTGERIYVFNKKTTDLINTEIEMKVHPRDCLLRTVSGHVTKV